MTALSLTLQHLSAATPVAAVDVTVPSQTLWWLNRATGLVLLVQFTLVVILGVLSTARRLPFKMPAFVTNELHRKLALMTVALLGIHIVTAVLDSYVDIDVWDAVVPFASPYRPIWLGLGTLAVDLLVAALIATAWRRRLSERTWRAVHAFTYVAWAASVLHGLGTGTDARNRAVQVVTAVCVLLVVMAVAARVAGLVALPQPARITALMGLAVAPVLVTLWAVGGPLAPGWAEKAGTPPPESTATVAVTP